jgi:hypothetical protein
VNFLLKSNADISLRFRASAPGTDWAKSDSESAVLSIFVDNNYEQDVVLWNGASAHDYAVALGETPAGKHKIEFRFSTLKSPKNAGSINLLGGTITTQPYKNELDKAVHKFAPILIGRDKLDNNHNDTPLALYYEILKNPDHSIDISYGYVFSNEDAGDAIRPARQQARWGRLSDIQHVFTTTIDAKFNKLDEKLEGAGHQIKKFDGRYEGTHPIIMTCTKNNMVTDNNLNLCAEDSLRFHMLPDFELKQNEPMGELMRLNTLWFLISAKELEREKKIMSDDEWTSIPPRLWKVLLSCEKMPDPRRYVYVQYDATNPDRSPVAIQITLNNNEVYSSDFDSPDTALCRSGWCQTAVLIPSNTRDSDIKEISVQAKKPTGQISKQLQAQLGHIFRLSNDFTPMEVIAHQDNANKPQTLH